MNMLRELGPLLSYMRRYRWGYLWGTLACIATNIAAVQGPQILRKAIDELERGVSRERIVFLACIFVAIYLVKGVFLYAQRWILIGISREIEFDLRNDLFRQLERQDANFYQKYRTGDVMARMTNDLNAVRMLLGPALMYSANTVFFTVGALYFLLRISPWLTLVAWAPMPLASILVQYFGRKIHDRFEKIQESFSEISVAGTGELLGRAPGTCFRPRTVADEPVRKTEPAIYFARPGPGSAHGNAVANARVHPGHRHDHHLARGRT